MVPPQDNKTTSKNDDYSSSSYVTNSMRRHRSNRLPMPLFASDDSRSLYAEFTSPTPTRPRETGALGPASDESSFSSPLGRPSCIPKSNGHLVQILDDVLSILSDKDDIFSLGLDMTNRMPDTFHSSFPSNEAESDDERADQ